MNEALAQSRLGSERARRLKRSTEEVVTAGQNTYVRFLKAGIDN